MSGSVPPTPDDPRATHEAAATVANEIAKSDEWRDRWGLPEGLDVKIAVEDARSLVTAAERAQKLEEALLLADKLADRWEEIDDRANDFGRAWELVNYREARAALAGVVRDG